MTPAVPTTVGRPWVCRRGNNRHDTDNSDAVLNPVCPTCVPPYGAIYPRFKLLLPHCAYSLCRTPIGRAWRGSETDGRWQAAQRLQQTQMARSRRLGELHVSGAFILKSVTPIRQHSPSLFKYTDGGGGRSDITMYLHLAGLYHQSSVLSQT